MDSQQFQEWFNHPLTKEFLKFLTRSREEYQAEVKVNLLDPDPVKFTVRVAFNQGKIELIEEILEMKNAQNQAG